MASSLLGMSESGDGDRSFRGIFVSFLPSLSSSTPLANMILMPILPDVADPHPNSPIKSPSPNPSSSSPPPPSCQPYFKPSPRPQPLYLHPNPLPTSSSSPPLTRPATCPLRWATRRGPTSCFSTVMMPHVEPLILSLHPKLATRTSAKEPPSSASPPAPKVFPKASSPSLFPSLPFPSSSASVVLPPSLSLSFLR
jgi:hypothetical protein